MSTPFEIAELAKVPTLSETIYSETLREMLKAKKEGDFGRYSTLLESGHALLVDAGMLVELQPVCLAHIESFLRYTHLDAQVSE